VHSVRIKATPTPPAADPPRAWIDEVYDGISGATAWLRDAETARLDQRAFAIIEESERYGKGVAASNGMVWM